MNRFDRFASPLARRSTLAGASALAFLLACGTPADPDAGVDAAAPPRDTGPQTPDAGTDAGPRPDAGSGCTEGCGAAALAIGVIHSCALRENGEVLCWGRNQELQLGDNRTRHDDCAPVGQSPIDCSGAPVNVRYQAAASRPIIDDATQITSEGFATGCALRPGGEIWCWSRETVPQAAGGQQNLRPVAQLEADFADVRQVSASGSNICAVQGESGALSCLGRGSIGQLGNNTFTELAIDPVAVMVAAGRGGVLDGGLPLDGGVPVDAGGLGMDAGVDAGAPMMDAGPIELTPLLDVIEVAISGGFSCARTSSQVWCWGANLDGQLGDGAVHQECVISATERFDCSPFAVLVGGADSPLGTVSDIAVGSRHACAVRDGEVYCWGDNRSGQAGQPESMPTVAMPARVGEFSDAVEVAAGSGFSCARRSGGEVVCWGANLDGQLGDGVQDHSALCRSGDDDVDCSRTPVTVMTVSDASALGAKASHACAVRADGSVWCWGSNDSRELGDGTRERRFAPVMVMNTGAR